MEEEDRELRRVYSTNTGTNDGRTRRGLEGHREKDGGREDIDAFKALFLCPFSVRRM